MYGIIPKSGFDMNPLTVRLNWPFREVSYYHMLRAGLCRQYIPDWLATRPALSRK